MGDECEAEKWASRHVDEQGLHLFVVTYGEESVGVNPLKYYSGFKMDLGKDLRAFEVKFLWWQIKGMKFKETLNFFIFVNLLKNNFFVKDFLNALITSSQ